jgi:hypothetical protein
MKKIVHDEATKYKTNIDQISGFLTAPVVLARTGVQLYSGSEIGVKDKSNEMIGVNRPASEVFDKKSIASFTNLIVTDDHPSNPVTVDNVKRLQKGSVSGVFFDEKEQVLKGLLTITDKATIEKIKDGKVEVSVGYSHDLKEQSGVENGVKYDYVQKNIRANHLAIVDAGRCGSACKITIDNGELPLMKKITLDGIEYEIDSAQLAQAIRKQQKSYDAKVEKLEKEKEETDEEKKKWFEEKKKSDKEKDELKKEKEKAEATKDSLLAKDSKYTEDEINKLVTAKATLLLDAKKILGDKMPECVTCDKEIKAAVISRVNGLDVSGKTNDYIDAAYDMAIIQFEKAKKGVSELGKDFQKDSKNRSTAYQKYVADHLGGE